ncbi:HK97-gp10 family putative phage morphogenesis protein [Pseudonocardia sp. RS010]|uniref:HK97-gp10 family putative phage morphogenesis protein n=1 Tax=Pseudonocardia sp. RS010 TaxID=3385979 RepID=UPI0039A2F0F9
MARIKVTGDKKLAAQLEKLAGQGRAICVEALESWGDDVRDDSRRRAPRDTGEMASQIEAVVSPAALTCTVGVDADWEEPGYYAPFVEHGTSEMEAQPFLWPAFRAHRDLRPYVRPALEKRL